jgi:ankyrin repeat protein
MTPLMLASREGDVATVKLLVAAGADVRAKNPTGMTPAIIAIYNGHPDVAMYLIEHGSDPNDGSLYSAVDFHNMPREEVRPAAKHNEQYTLPDVVTALIAKGADPTVVNGVPQPYATYNIASKPTISPLVRALGDKDIEILPSLVSVPGILASDKVKAPLSIILQGSRTRAGGQFVKPNELVFRIVHPDDSEQAMLICLKNGADINAVDDQGQSALHAAAQAGNEKIIRFLADHKATLDIKDKNGLTPLDLAEGKTPPPGAAGAGGGRGGGGRGGRGGNAGDNPGAGAGSAVADTVPGDNAGGNNADDNTVGNTAGDNASGNNAGGGTIARNQGRAGRGGRGGNGSPQAAAVLRELMGLPPASPNPVSK